MKAETKRWSSSKNVAVLFVLFILHITWVQVEHIIEPYFCPKKSIWPEDTNIEILSLINH